MKASAWRRASLAAVALAAVVAAAGRRFRTLEQRLRDPLSRINHIVVDLRGEPQLRQPVRRLGGSQRPRERRRRSHDAGRPGGGAVHLPEAERRQPRVAAGDVQRRGARLLERVPEHVVRDRRAASHRRRRRARHRRRPSRSRTASPNGQGLPGGCTRDLVHKFYQEQYQLNGGAQNRYRSEATRSA